MRITMVGDGWCPDAPGGLNRYFRQLFDGLGRVGHDPAGVVLGPVDSPPAALHVAGDTGRPVPGRLVRSARSVVRLAPGADVLDLHFALYSLLPLQAPAVRRMPTVVHFHGPWAKESAATGAGSASVAALRAVEGLVYRRAHRCVVLSDSFRDELTAYGVPPDRIRKVAPGVDTGRFTAGDDAARSVARARLGLGAGTDRFVAVAVRRLVPRMGLDLLLRAWARVVDRPATARARGPLLVLVGEGEQRPLLEALVRELGLAGSVRLAGRVPEDELAAWYTAADVAVVPSTSLEGFGLVLLEALACGTPVLASRTGGIAEALDGLPGSPLLPAGDVDAWARRLADAVAGRPGLPSRAQARAHAERFSWDRTALAVADVYREAIDEARARGPVVAA